MHQQNINQQQIRQTTVQGILRDWNCLFHVEIAAVLHETISLQNNETARQKGVHNYVVSTLNVFCKDI